MLRERTKPILCRPSGAWTLILVRYYNHIAPIGALEIGVASVKVHLLIVPEGRHNCRINDPPAFKLRKSDIKTILSIPLRNISYITICRNFFLRALRELSG